MGNIMLSWAGCEPVEAMEEPQTVVVAQPNSLSTLASGVSFGSTAGNLGAVAPVCELHVVIVVADLPWVLENRFNDPNSSR